MAYEMTLTVEAEDKEGIINVLRNAAFTLEHTEVDNFSGELCSSTGKMAECDWVLVEE